MNYKKIDSVISITPEESLLLQSISTTQFLLILHVENFIKSKTFNEIYKKNIDWKNILIQSTLWNPATVQMCLYSCLVVPKELKLDDLSDVLNLLNSEIAHLINLDSSCSTYKKDTESINYIRHIRNATAHTNITLSDNVFTLIDTNPKTNETCKIAITSQNMFKLIDNLQKNILTFIHTRH